MDVIKAVLFDLLHFAFAGLLNRNVTPAPVAKPLALPLQASHLSLLAPAHVPTKSVPKKHVAVEPTQPTQLFSVREFVSVDEAKMYIHPTVTFDGLVAILNYGTAVTVLHHEGRWTSITTESLSGWVLKDSLTSDYPSLVPLFSFGACYPSDAPETKKLRLFIKDEFGAGKLSLPLMSPEYVTYRLALKNIRFAWNNVRPRVAGEWQRLLKGTPGIHSGILPKTGSVMEYLTEMGGQLAYVEAVFPDETIRVSLIREDDESRYIEQVYTKEEWKELGPVFIEVA